MNLFARSLQSENVLYRDACQMWVEISTAQQKKFKEEIEPPELHSAPLPLPVHDVDVGFVIFTFTTVDCCEHRGYSRECAMCCGECLVPLCMEHSGLFDAAGVSRCHEHEHSNGAACPCADCVLTSGGLQVVTANSRLCSHRGCLQPEAGTCLECAAGLCHFHLGQCCPRMKSTCCSHGPKLSDPMGTSDVETEVVADPGKICSTASLDLSCFEGDSSKKIMRDHKARRAKCVRSSLDDFVMYMRLARLLTLGCEGWTSARQLVGSLSKLRLSRKKLAMAVALLQSSAGGSKFVCHMYDIGEVWSRSDHSSAVRGCEKACFPARFLQPAHAHS